MQSYVMLDVGGTNIKAGLVSISDIISYDAFPV